jgi:hypothetical protein
MSYLAFLSNDLIGQPSRDSARKWLQRVGRFGVVPGLWISMWYWFPNSLGIWFLLVGFYAALLVGFGIKGAIGTLRHHAPADWPASMLHVGNWFVLTGVLAVVYLLAWLLFRVLLLGENPFPQ